MLLSPLPPISAHFAMRPAADARPSASSIPSHFDSSTLAHSPPYDASLYDFAHHDAAAAAASQQRLQPANELELSSYRIGNKRVRPNHYADSIHASPDPDTLANTPVTSVEHPTSNFRSTYNTASSNVGASFAPGPPGQFPSPYQSQLVSLPSAPSYSSAPSLTDASSTSLYSPYSAIVPADQGNDQVDAIHQSSISQSSTPHPSYLSHMSSTPQDYRPSESSAPYGVSLTASHFYGNTEHYGTTSHASPSMGYGKSEDWPDAQWACQQSYNQGHPNTLYHGAAELYGKDASLHIKLQSLAVLDNLATQIILSLAKPSLAEIEKLSSGTGSDEERQAYHTRKNLFDQTRKVYSRDSPFIDAVAIQLFTPSQQEIIRKANRATFISSLLESHDVSFFDLNEYFLEVFVPSGQRLLKWQGAIYLELKTQVYISALLNSDGEVGALLDELFPVDLEDKIIARHPDAPHLVPSEQDFVERARARKQYLQAEPAENALAALPRKYAWQDFLREFSTSINKNVESLLNPPNRSGSTTEFRRNGSHDDSSRRNSPPHGAGGCDPRGYTNFGALLPDPNLIGAQFNVSHHETLAALSSQPQRKTSNSSDGAKVSATTRQPWKQEEEDALLAGLEEVKGPYWSRILSMYGRGGSRSEVLKDRNQIQLKDKARNLKLWYLKMGNEVPVCLQGVTGELRKRGGAKVRAALGLSDDGGANTGAGVRKPSPKRM
ncbi:telomere repeat binding factor-domain-containing protein [Elsinoe ampelina]|uniref:Telomere repeat binding factor-domain-containing protein n=1 Tax=Elsinoe ampelina TaxID=302913 RepID=A0A6A6GNP9_9PEZI|nr:telomere repeat binding factor-domain-containing protein [Elsinoe ampelina]